MLEKLSYTELRALNSLCKQWLKNNSWLAKVSDEDIEKLVDARKIERELDRRAREE